jgi:serine carboxypeptidase-like clade 1
MSVWCFASVLAIAHASFVSVTSLPGWNGTLPSKWYSGFVDVSPSPLGTKMFEHYVFIESENDPANDPVVLWMNGGPGASSMYGLFVEMGPLLLKDDSLQTDEYRRTGVPTLQYNEFGWTQFANVLILEFSPPVGFSFCSPPGPAGNGTSCGAWNDTTTLTANYKALLGFFKDMPRFVQNPLFLIGESYAGVYTPMLANAILDGASTFALNLQGMGIIDGCQGTEVLCGRKPSPLQRGLGPWYDLLFFYGHAQVSNSHYNAIVKTCGEPALRSGNLTTACSALVDSFYSSLGGYYGYNLYDTCSAGGVFLPGHVKHSGWGRKVPVNPQRRHNGNPLGPVSHTGYECSGSAMDIWIALPAVRTALGVAVNSNFFDTDNGVGFVYHATFENVLPIFSRLRSSGIRTATFSADADPALNTFVLQDIFFDWWAQEGVAVKEDWRPWAFSSNKTESRFSAGYVQTYNGDFWFATVRGSGHMIPYFMPREAFVLFQTFIAGQSLPHQGTK